MKKLLTALLTLVLVLCTACGKSDTLGGTPAAMPGEVNIAVLKGPTAIAMVNLMDSSDKGETSLKYNFSIAGVADEITADLIKGNVQIAAVPANLASVLYNKTEGGVRVMAINNLGVLYVVETGDEIGGLADLAGKTIYTTGKGTTPEYTLNRLLTSVGIDPAKDVNIEFKSEATEIAAAMAASDKSESFIAMLPQPYVTVVTTQNEGAHIVLDVNEEWNKHVSSDSSIVTGVIAVNTSFAEQYPDAVKTFISEFTASADKANSDVEGTAALVEGYDIFKAAIAKKAIPMCNIVSMTGSDMKANVSAYLKVLYDQNPASVGGSLPGDDFYYGAD